MAGPSKSSKADRNKVSCTRYKNESRQELNQLRRLIRHAKRVMKFQGGQLGVFAPNALGKDVAAAFAKINAKVPNYEIKRVCGELHVALA